MASAQEEVAGAGANQNMKLVLPGERCNELGVQSL